MPNRQTHLRFDEYLKERGIIYDDTVATTVHNRLDKGVKKYGPDHRELDFWHSEEGLREWIGGLPANMLQTTATDYLRAGLGHIALDEMKQRNPEKTDGELFKLAYRSYSQKGYGRTRFVS